jgi:hypothetical protein
MDLAIALKERYPYSMHPKYFKFDFIGIERCGWLRVYLGTDRHFVLREKDALIELVQSFGLEPSFDVGWEWETVYNKEFNVNVRQATPSYALFVSGRNKVFQQTLNFLSDTKDELYDFCIRDLLEAIVKERDIPMTNFGSSSRNEMGFMITFYNKKAAEEFNRSDLLNGRKTSWTKPDASHKYQCQIFMRDKEPADEEIVSLGVLTGNSSKVKRTKRVKKVEKLDPSELYLKVQSGELSLEEFTQLIKNC